jgi:serine/threonine protein kinase
LLMKKLRGRMQIKREISTMKLIKHPNVVRIYEVPFVIFQLILQDKVVDQKRAKVRNS